MTARTTQNTNFERLLIDLVGTPVQICEAYEAFATGGDEARAVLVAHRKYSNPRVREMIIQLLGRSVLANDKTDALVMDALSDFDPEVVVEAIQGVLQRELCKLLCEETILNAERIIRSPQRKSTLCSAPESHWKTP